MKYVIVDGGLGNQMFQYAFLLALRERDNEVRLFLACDKWEHEAGFELNRVFGIEHERCLWEFLYSRMTYPFRKLFYLFHKRYCGRNFRYGEEDLKVEGVGAYYGTWQSEKYFLPVQAKVRDAFRFDLSRLNKESKDVLATIAKTQAEGRMPVSVHVRRGDYQSEAFKNGFGNCCPLAYYKRAIEYMKEQTKNPLFVFFSDDMTWVRENISIGDAIYVEHNRTLDAWQDMFLMTQCRHHIIANSTFSWWGAWLNERTDKIVVAPKRWWYTVERDDVVPQNWIRI